LRRQGEEKAGNRREFILIRQQELLSLQTIKQEIQSINFEGRRPHMDAHEQHWLSTDTRFASTFRHAAAHLQKQAE
jgi:hypothetical protein